MPPLPTTMRVIERAVYRGPHRFSNTPMVRVQLDLGPLRDLPSDRLHGFNDRLLDAVPTLIHHGCSGRRPGGFVRRLRDGTWIGHVTEHVALELQHLAGHRATRGKTRAVPGHPGVYNVMFAYVEREVGLAAARMALELVCRLLPRGLNSVAGLDLLGSSLARDLRDGVVSGFTALSAIVRRTALGPTTQSLVDAARARDIPVERLNERSLGRISAQVFDEVIFRERPDGRGRAAGGVVSLLTEGARAAGMAPNRIRRILDERQAMDAALRSAGPRDLVVLTPTDVEAVWQQAISFRLARTRVRA